MSPFEQIRLWLRRGKADAGKAWRETETRLDADLSAKERQLTETPEQGLARTQAEIETEADPFDEVRRRIQGKPDHA